MKTDDYVIRFEDLRNTDVELVGGKNASLGEMLSQLKGAGVKVPDGFATTVDAFQDFLKSNGLKEKIDLKLRELDISDLGELARTGAQIREWIMEAPFSEKLMFEIDAAYTHLTEKEGKLSSYAVRSSATAEDLPDASFAGQQESFLNIKGLDNILSATKRVYASLYNDRAISYRVHKGFDHSLVGLSVGVQRMVRSDLDSSGVMFTLDTESGFDGVIFITSSYGLGETVVQGQVNPDEFYLFKSALEAGRPSIVKKVLGSKLEKMIFSKSNSAETSTLLEKVESNEQNRFSINNEVAQELGRIAIDIEKHYGRPMDIEWGRDGTNGQIYVLQARPETVKSNKSPEKQKRFKIKNRGEVLVTGRAIGNKVGSGNVRLVESATEMDRVQEGDILVTDMTDPDWEPVMKRASAIVTNRGGRTCHAAIIARELGIPAIVGCNEATRLVKEDLQVTVSCAEGDTGYVYLGELDVEVDDIELDKLEEIPVKIMMNVANPDLAFDFQRLPNSGVGLARLEFIIARMIGVHPKAALAYPDLNKDVKRKIEERMRGYSSAKEFYIEKLTEGIATLGSAFYPEPVIVRLSDFKSNEYSSLIGGKEYEPEEENPMLGFRGASRYISKDFRDCFSLECEALKRVRNDIGLTNIEIMVPFVRTLDEAKSVIALLADQGLERGVNGLRVIMMCEIPSNAILAKEFLEFFDGFSIGSNDMTQLTLGLDRDSGLIAGQFDERDKAVKSMLNLAIDACRKAGKYVGICGQGPSDHSDFAEWLMDQGIDSISLNPDTVIDTWVYLGKYSNKKDTRLV